MSKTNDIFKIAGTIFILFIITVVLAFLTKGQIINEWLALSFFIFVFFIILIWLVLSFIFKLKPESLEEDAPSSGMDKYMRRINDILISRPAGEPIQWDGGKYTKYFKTTITDYNRQPHEFVAIVGQLKKSLKTVVLIYHVDKDDIVRFFGEPSVRLIRDPFDNFKPFESSTRAFNPFIDKEYLNKKGININVGNRRRHEYFDDDDNDALNDLNNLRQ